jgi:hypothetical protein
VSFWCNCFRMNTCARAMEVLILKELARTADEEVERRKVEGGKREKSAPRRRGNERGRIPRGVSHVWQTKGLREQVFGSVAMIGLRGGPFGSVASKGVRREELRCSELEMERRVRLTGGRAVQNLLWTAWRGRPGAAHGMPRPGRGKRLIVARIMNGVHRA